MAPRGNPLFVVIGSIVLSIAFSQNGFVSSQRLGSSVELSEEWGVYRPAYPAALDKSPVNHGARHSHNQRSRRYLQSKSGSKSGSNSPKSGSGSGSNDIFNDNNSGGGSNDDCRSADRSRRGRRMLGSKSKGRSGLPLCTPSPTSAQPTVPTTPPPTASPTSAIPTEAPTTALPTVAQTTSLPTVAQITALPTVAQTTAPPSSTPTTAGPTLTSVAPTTTAPTLAIPTTEGPSTALPTTASPTTVSPPLAALTRDGTALAVRSQGCVERLFSLNVDIQLYFALGFFMPCADETEEAGIRVAIKEALKQNFDTKVSDWEGSVVFGNFLFDVTQVQDNGGVDGGRRGRALRSAGDGGHLKKNGFQPHQARRFLQESACPARTVDCSAMVADYCRWGCIGVAATDCGSPHSPTKSWTLLADDIRSRLAGLGLQCLGIADQLNVVVTEPNLAQL